jgi:hypothetical protein
MQLSEIHILHISLEEEFVFYPWIVVVVDELDQISFVYLIRLESDCLETHFHLGESFIVSLLQSRHTDPIAPDIGDRLLLREC